MRQLRVKALKTLNISVIDHENLTNKRESTMQNPRDPNQNIGNPPGHLDPDYNGEGGGGGGAEEQMVPPAYNNSEAAIRRRRHIEPIYRNSDEATARRRYRQVLEIQLKNIGDGINNEMQMEPRKPTVEEKTSTNSDLTKPEEDHNHEPEAGGGGGGGEEAPAKLTRTSSNLTPPKLTRYEKRRDSDEEYIDRKHEPEPAPPGRFPPGYQDPIEAAPRPVHPPAPRVVPIEGDAVPPHAAPVADLNDGDNFPPPPPQQLAPVLRRRGGMMENQPENLEDAQPPPPSAT